jgi:hypothetical protein
MVDPNTEAHANPYIGDGPNYDMLRGVIGNRARPMTDVYTRLANLRRTDLDSRLVSVNDDPEAARQWVEIRGLMQVSPRLFLCWGRAERSGFAGPG